MNTTNLLAGIILLFIGLRFDIGSIAYGFTGSMMFQLTGILTLTTGIIPLSSKDKELKK